MNAASRDSVPGVGVRIRTAGLALGPEAGERVGVDPERVDLGPSRTGRQVGERLLVEDLEHRVAHVDIVSRSAQVASSTQEHGS